jgi:hypothetical protein
VRADDGECRTLAKPRTDKEKADPGLCPHCNP